MRRFKTNTIGVEQGSRVLFADFANGGPMWTAKGPREIRVPVTFSEPFLAPPVVMVGVAMWDIDHRQNSRTDINADAVSTTGFEIVFRTWDDTRIARVRADWTAMGPLRDEDDWDV